MQFNTSRWKIFSRRLKFNVHSSSIETNLFTLYLFPLALAVYFNMLVKHKLDYFHLFVGDLPFVWLWPITMPNISIILLYFCCYSKSIRILSFNINNLLCQWVCQSVRLILTSSDFIHRLFRFFQIYYTYIHFTYQFVDNVLKFTWKSYSISTNITDSFLEIKS